jgi:hypothetical protein
MKIHRGQSGVRLIGGVHALPVGEDVLMVTYYRPKPVDKLEFGAEFERQKLRILRYAHDVQRYGNGWTAPEEDAPLLEVTREKIAPLLDFIIQHTAEAGPFEDEHTGLALPFDELKPEHYRDALYMAQYADLVALARAVIQSDGLAEEQRVRLDALLDLEVSGGCACLACTGDREQDKHCKLAPLQPTHDVDWLIAQHQLRIGPDGTVPTDAPGWLVHVHDAWVIAREKAREKKRFEEAQRKLAAELLGGEVH